MFHAARPHIGIRRPKQAGGLADYRLLRLGVALRGALGHVVARAVSHDFVGDGLRIRAGKIVVLSELQTLTDV